MGLFDGLYVRKRARAYLEVMQKHREPGFAISLARDGDDGSIAAAAVAWILKHHPGKFAVVKDADELQLCRASELRSGLTPETREKMALQDIFTDDPSKLED